MEGTEKGLMGGEMEQWFNKIAKVEPGQQERFLLCWLKWSSSQPY
jgi:hypothetical protein